MRVFNSNLVANLFALFDYLKRDFELIRHINVVLLLSGQRDVLLIPIPLKMCNTICNTPTHLLTGTMGSFTSLCGALLLIFGVLKQNSKRAKEQMQQKAYLPSLVLATFPVFAFLLLTFSSLNSSSSSSSSNSSPSSSSSLSSSSSRNSSLHPLSTARRFNSL